MIDRTLAGYIYESRRLVAKILGNHRIRGGSPCPGAELRPLPEPLGGEVVHAAVDGGHSMITFEGFTFYVVRAWAHLFGRAREQGAGWLGVLIPPHEPEYRVPVYRDVLESAVLLGDGVGQGWNLVEEARLVLFDGSIRTALRWWRGRDPSNRRMSERLREAEQSLRALVAGGVEIPGVDAGDCLDGCVESLVAGAGRRPVAPWLAMYLAAEYPGIEGLDWIPVLEVVEKLYLLKRVLEEAWRQDGLVLFLSKHSTSSRLCRGKHSDIFYLNRIHPVEPGYVLAEGPLLGAYEIARLVGVDVKQLYPPVLGIHDFYTRRIAAVEFYVRLQRGGPFLLGDLVIDVERHMDMLEDPYGAVEKALAMLLSTPVSQGYPLSLLVAHHHSRILPEEALAAARSMGLGAEHLARSMLRR